jgi:hypothetical protein
MSQPVLVRSSMRTWDFTLLVIAGMGAFVGGWIVFANGERGVGIALQVLGGLCAVGSAVGLQRRIARRQWVTASDNGFTLSDRRGESEYEDAQVRSLALNLKSNYAEGVEKSVTRTLLIWLDETDENDSSERLELKSTFKPDEADPLAILIQRLSQRVLDRARTKLREGSTFSGSGWVLEKQNLVVSAKPEPLHAPLGDIAMTGIVDQKLCLWRRGDDEAWARIPIDSVNAYVLKWLLDERLAERPGEDDSTTEGGLGRVLFERKPRAAQTVICLLGGFALLLAALGLIVGGLVGRQGKPVPMILLGLGCLLGAVGCGYGILHARYVRFRCHQFGLVKRGVRRSRSLRYEHVEAFTYQSTRHYHNGVYTGSIFVLDFDPVAEHKANRIKYSVTLHNADTELDNLRDQVAGIIATRMRRDIAAGREVAWTPALTFRGDSMVYRASGLFAKKEAVTIPLAEIDSYKMDQGVCYLFLKQRKKAAVQENMHARNFFPGFYCMLGLVSAAAAPPEPAYEDAAEAGNDDSTT